MVPMKRRALCHGLLGFDQDNGMMSFDELRENILIYYAYSCMRAGGGPRYAMTSVLCNFTSCLILLNLKQ